MEKSELPKRARRTRVIKKYPNRRLYDTETSSYVTLAQVRQLVLEHEPFVVQDNKTGKDLTRAVLLQILLEEEAAGEPIFSEQALAGIIRFYGCAMQGFVGSYLEKSIHAMVEMQATLARQSGELTPELWAHVARMQSLMLQSMMAGHVEHSRTAFAQFQDQMTRHAEQIFSAFGMLGPR